MLCCKYKLELKRIIHRLFSKKKKKKKKKVGLRL